VPKPIVTKLHPSLYFRQAKALAGVGVPGAEKPDEESEEALERKKRKAALKKLKKKKKRKKMMARLSFAADDDMEDGDGDGDGEDTANVSTAGAIRNLGSCVDHSPIRCLVGAAQDNKESDEPQKKFGKFGKDPTVNTDFLPDKDREIAEAKLRAKLTEEWVKHQEKVKGESLQVTYSYWDGSGHRRDIIVTKGTTVRRFLEAVRKDLVQEFPELRSVSVENLMYVKEDLIIPHNYSFYDLIISKARGKSGPLFHFDVHDDIRIGPNDSRIEKDESHPGKIVERRWFEVRRLPFLPRNHAVAQHALSAPS